MLCRASQRLRAWPAVPGPMHVVVLWRQEPQPWSSVSTSLESLVVQNSEKNCP